MSRVGIGFRSHHSNPAELYKLDKGEFFNQNATGWNPHGAYNLELRSLSQTGTDQIDGLMHSTNHSWINDQLKQA